MLEFNIACRTVGNTVVSLSGNPWDILQTRDIFARLLATADITPDDFAQFLTTLDYPHGDVQAAVPISEIGATASTAARVDLESTKDCVHEVAVPPDYDYVRTTYICKVKKYKNAFACKNI